MASAIRLQSIGIKTTIFEANNYPGGKLTLIEKDGFRFDAGPSLFTLPRLLDDVYKSAGLNPRDYYQFEQVPVACHYFWPDGKKFNAFYDKVALKAELEKQLEIDGNVVLNYLEHSKKLYTEAGEIFLNNSLHKAKTWLSKDVLQTLLQISKYDLFKSMNAANETRLQDPKLVQLFNRYATYNGSNPYQAPGILNSIPHLEFNEGTFFPKGGMHSITEGLYKAALDLGVVFNFNHRVDEIIVKNKKVEGVKSKGKIHQAELVISNMDIYPTYEKLLPTQKTPTRVKTQERSSSGLIFYWGINRAFSELGLHNIFFSGDYKTEFSQLFEEKTIGNDPTVYVNITSKLNPSDAPKGTENWFVLINAPSNEGQDWKAITKQTRTNVIKKLSTMLGCDFSQYIVTEEVLDPIGIEAKTSSFKGSLYGTSSNDRMAAFLRHPNFSSSVKNLYFAGGSVHPGGGIPLCLLSAKITASLIKSDLKI